MLWWMRRHYIIVAFNLKVMSALVSFFILWTLFTSLFLTSLLSVANLRNIKFIELFSSNNAISSSAYWPFRPFWPTSFLWSQSLRLKRFFTSCKNWIYARSFRFCRQRHTTSVRSQIELIRVDANHVFITWLPIFEVIHLRNLDLVFFLRVKHILTTEVLVGVFTMQNFQRTWKHLHLIELAIFLITWGSFIRNIKL